MILPTGFSLTRNWHNCAFPEQVAWVHQTIRIFGRPVFLPRLTAWYGTNAYTYSKIKNVPAQMPQWLEHLRKRLERETGVSFNSALCNLYRDGNDSVAYHSDDEPELGENPTIASVSFGAPRKFLVRGLGKTHSLMLTHGDLLLMYGRSQKDFVHCVPKTTRLMGPRINVTFRYIV